MGFLQRLIGLCTIHFCLNALHQKFLILLDVVASLSCRIATPQTQLVRVSLGILFHRCTTEFEVVGYVSDGMPLLKTFLDLQDEHPLILFNCG